MLRSQEAYLNLSKVSYLDLTWPWRFEYIWGLMKYIWHLIISSSFHFQNTISIISVLRYNIKCPQCNYRMIQAFLSALIRKTTSSGYNYHVLMILKAFEISFKTKWFHTTSFLLVFFYWPGNFVINGMVSLIRADLENYYGNDLVGNYPGSVLAFRSWFRNVFIQCVLATEKKREKSKLKTFPTSKMGISTRFDITLKVTTRVWVKVRLKV